MRRAAAVAAVVVLATGCSRLTGLGPDGADTPGSSAAQSAGPASTSSTMQMRPVLEIYEPSTKQPKPTCAGGDPCDAATLLQPEVVLRGAEGGATYRLGSVVVTDADVESARSIYTPQTSGGDAWTIEIILTDQGRLTFADATSDMVGRQVAVVIDGLVVSAPTVNEPITMGAIQITGDFSRSEADRVVAALSP
jgi:preprotein translocase subunit SecD